MLTRIIRVLASGQWCAPSISDEKFADDGSAWLAKVAQSLGLNPKACELVTFKDDDDPRGSADNWLREDNPALTPDPDRNGFYVGCMTALGLDRADAILSPRPSFVLAMNASNWTVARQIIDRATNDKEMTADERTTVLGLMTQFHIPASS